MSAVFRYTLPLKGGVPVVDLSGYDHFVEWLVYGENSWLKTHYPNFNIQAYSQAEMRDAANWQKLGGIDFISPIVENGKVTAFEYNTISDYHGDITDDAEMIAYHTFFCHHTDWDVPGTVTTFIKNAS